MQAFNSANASAYPPIYYNGDGTAPIFNKDIITNLEDAAGIIQKWSGIDNSQHSNPNHVNKGEGGRGQDTLVSKVSAWIFKPFYVVRGDLVTQCSNFSKYAEKAKAFADKYRQMNADYGNKHEHLSLLTSIGEATHAIFEGWSQDAKLKEIAVIRALMGALLVGIGAAMGSTPTLVVGGGVAIAAGGMFLVQKVSNSINSQNEEKRIRGIFQQLHQLKGETTRELGNPS